MDYHHNYSKLPILACISESYEFLWSHRSEFLRMCTPCVNFSLCAHHCLFNLSSTRFKPTNSLCFARGSSNFLYAMFGVAWHRRSPPTEQITIWEALRWDSEDVILYTFHYSGHLCHDSTSIFLILLFESKTDGLSIFSGSIGINPRNLIVLVFVSASLWMLIFTRLSLWLPAAAVDEKHSIISIWRLGKENGWSLVAITLGAMLPLAFLISLALSLVVSIVTSLGIQSNLTGLLITGLALGFTKYLALAAEITALSIAYRKLSSPNI